MLYFLHCTSVLSFYTDVVVTLSIDKLTTEYFQIPLIYVEQLLQFERIIHWFNIKRSYKTDSQLFQSAHETPSLYVWGYTGLKSRANWDATGLKTVVSEFLRDFRIIRGGDCLRTWKDICFVSSWHFQYIHRYQNTPTTENTIKSFWMCNNLYSFHVDSCCIFLNSALSCEVAI